MAKAKPKDEAKFETLMDELEAIVERLENDDLDLEEALGAFEDGIKLSRRLHDRLGRAEERIEILLSQADGSLEATPFDETDEVDHD